MSQESFVGPAVQIATPVDRETLRKAVISALPVDYDDYTTLVRVVPATENAVGDREGYRAAIWGRPEQVADAVLAALQQWLPPESDYPSDEAMAAIAAACTCPGCMTGGRCIDDQPEDDGVCTECLYDGCRCTEGEDDD